MNDKFKSFLWLFVFITLTIIVANKTAEADTIHLTNGNTIYGSIHAFKPDPNKVRVTFKRGGFMLVKKDEIKTVEKNDRDHFEEWKKNEEPKEEK